MSSLSGSDRESVIFIAGLKFLLFWFWLQSITILLDIPVVSSIDSLKEFPCFKSTYLTKPFLSEIIGKVFYEYKKRDLDMEEYTEIIMDKTKKAPVDVIFMMDRKGAEESFNETQITRYRNMFVKQGYTVVNVHKKALAQY